MDAVKQAMFDQLTGASTPHEHPFPGNTLMHVDGFSTDSEGMEDADQETRTVVTDPAHAVVVTSLFPTPWGDTRHRPVIDIDLPVKLTESSTPGHFHLFIDRAMSWEHYLGILDSLASAGVVEPNYVKAARTRGHTCVRVPWVRKGDRHPELPAEAVRRRNELIDHHARQVVRTKGADAAALRALADALGGVG